jgi:hydrogenase nickel incorporation protein HypB
MPRPRVLEVSARTGQGLDGWIAWLEELRAPLAGAPARPHEHGHAHHHSHAHGHSHRHGKDHD